MSGALKWCGVDGAASVARSSFKGEHAMFI